MTNISPTKPYLRGVIHCHSRYSFDSAVGISAYLRAAKKKALDFIILTDHDTTAGSRDLRDAAARYLPSLQVPIAAEYLTDEGDLIAAFIDDDVRARTFAEFIREARRKNAVVLLPHPYDGHSSPAKIATECDLIEVVNCRTRESKNQRAAELAKSLGKRSYPSSDAHFARSIGNAIVEVENLGSLRTSILEGEIRWPLPRMTSRWEYGLSQLIKSWKRRDSVLARQMLKRACDEIINLARRTKLR